MSKPKSLISLSPQEFVHFLQGENISRFYFVYDSKNNVLKSSHAQLQTIADFIQSDKRDFMRHEGMFFQITRHSIATARGVICGMEAALEFISDAGSQGKTVAVQGMGNVGGPLIRFLFDKKVKKVVACDINPDLVQHLKGELSDKDFEASMVSSGDNSIFQAECDIFWIISRLVVVLRRTKWAISN